MLQPKSASHEGLPDHSDHRVRTPVLLLPGHAHVAHIAPQHGGFAMAYENILVRTEGRVGIITLNRPQALNALNGKLMDELSEVISGFEADHEIRCVILTGSEKAFAAGADITEMAGLGFVEAYTQDFITKNWERVARARKP